MMRHLALAVCFLFLLSVEAFPQSIMCPTRPTGDNSNSCASTAFVQTAVSGAVTPPLVQGHIFVGNASNVSTDVAMSGDCGIVAAGTITCTKLNNVSISLGGTFSTAGALSLPTVVQGDLWYGSAAGTISALGKNASATRYLSNTGASNNPAWAQVDLSNGVTGTLPGANGGTGLSTAAVGDLIYASATTPTWAALADVATGNALISGGVNTAPLWGKIGLTTHVSGTLAGGNGGTNNAFFQVTGPTTSLKTFTFPDASATVLTTNAAVTVAQGGTGITSGTSGGIPYFSGATTIASSSALTANALVLGGGAGTAPTVLGSLGTTTTVLHGNAGGAPSFGAVVSGDITDGTVVNADLANMANATTKCRTTAGTGVPEDCTAAQLAAILGTNVKSTESFVVAASDETTALTASAGKITWRMPYAFTVASVRCSLTTAQASGSIFTVDINEGGVSILSTKVTIDNTEKTSQTAASPPVISDSSLADDGEMSIDIDQIGDGTAKGLKCSLIGTRT